MRHTYHKPHINPAHPPPPLGFICLGVCALVIVGFAYAIYSRQIAEEKRDMAVRFIMTEIVLVPITMLALVIQLAPKPLVQAISYVFVGTMLLLTFTGAQFKIGARMRTAISSWLNSRWPIKP